MMNQNSIITNLSIDLKKLNNELIEIKSTNSQNMMQLSTNLIDIASTPQVSSFIGTKLILGIIGSGVVYFYLTPVLAANTTFTLPSFKFLLIPIKSTIVDLILFLKEGHVLEFFRDGCTYRMALKGDQVLSLDARPIDSVNFRPVSEIITESNNSVSSTVEKVVDASTSCDAAVAAVYNDRVLDLLSAII